MAKRQAPRDIIYVGPVCSVETTETVRLVIPTEYGHYTRLHQTAKPTRDDFDEFVRQVHSKFGCNKDVRITVGETGISASVTDAK